mmetsp:Transcript_703/g.2097  ORF Transcript_703/g.2097 Transcript_703/m.2097 type:complete len:232 (-) Transcript_703:293-988(-)
MWTLTHGSRCWTWRPCLVCRFSRRLPFCSSAGPVGHISCQRLLRIWASVAIPGWRDVPGRFRCWGIGGAHQRRLMWLRCFGQLTGELRVGICPWANWTTEPPPVGGREKDVVEEQPRGEGGTACRCLFERWVRRAGETDEARVIIGGISVLLVAVEKRAHMLARDVVGTSVAQVVCASVAAQALRRLIYSRPPARRSSSLSLLPRPRAHLMANGDSSGTAHSPFPHGLSFF